MSLRKFKSSIPWSFATMALVACSATDRARDVERNDVGVANAAIKGPTLSKADERPKYVPGEIIVRFKEDAAVGAVADALMERGQAFSSLSKSGNIDRLNAQFGALRMKSRGENRKHRQAAIPVGKITSSVATLAASASARNARNASERSQSSNPFYRVEFSNPNLDVVQVAAQYAKDPTVAYAGPNRLYFTETVPIDPLYPQQWAHQETEAEAGWDIQLGLPSTVVAVIDTGVDYSHEDLTTQIWHDQNGKPGRDFVDIDTARFVAAGYTLDPAEDYLDDDDAPTDRAGHGTHCAGIVAAAHNGIGVAGVAPGVRVMPVRAGFKLVDGQNHSVSLLAEDSIVDSIYYAANNGASVISMSFGGYPSPLIKQAIEYAAAQGVVLVAAAGNSASSARSYPAAYAGVVAVSATGPTNTKSSYSNFGSWVSIAAPGGEIGSTGGVDCILSTIPGSAYTNYCGTSMATPYAAGLAALLKSADASASASEIRGRLIGTADAVDGDYRWNVGGGRVNIRRALTEPRAPALHLVGSTLSELTGNGDGIPGAGETARLALNFENEWAAANNVIMFITSTPLVKVKNPQWNVGYVPEFSALSNSTAPFEVAISPAALPGQEVSLEITIVANGEVHAVFPLKFNLGMKTYLSDFSSASSDISGDNVASVRFDEDSLSFNVYVLNLASGQEQKLTDMASAGDFMDMFSGPTNTAISGPIVVWQDERNGLGNANIYTYDLRSGATGPLLAETGTQTNPDIYGNVIVWTDTRNDSDGDIHLYDLSSHQETQLARPGSQVFPKISGNTVVWLNETTVGKELWAYDIGTQQEWRVAGISSDTRLMDLKFSRRTVAYTTEQPGTPATYQFLTVNVDGANAPIMLSSTEAPHIDVYKSTIVYNSNGLTTYNAANGVYENLIQAGTTKSDYFPIISGHRVAWERVTALKDRILALTTHGYKVGDANEDGQVDAKDSNDIATYSVGLPVARFNEDSADVNCDGQIGIVDALLVTRRVTNQIDYFPCELD